MFSQQPLLVKKPLNAIILTIFVIAASIVALAIMPPAYASISVKITPTSGPPGTVVQVSCSGFTPNGQAQASINGTVLGTRAANANGDINFNVTVPNFKAGQYTFVGEDLTTQAKEQVTFTITSSATASPSPTSTVPEFPSIVLALTVLIAASIATLYYTRKFQKNKQSHFHLPTFPNA